MGSFIFLTALLLGSEDPAELIRVSMEAGKSNTVKAANWLSREDIRRFDPQRKSKLVSWQTYEASIVEGQNYYRLTARNGKPLKKAEREDEQDKLDREAERRRKMARVRTAVATGMKSISMGSRYSLSLEHLIWHHDIQLAGENTTPEGREYWVVDTRLQPSAPLPKERNDMALAGNVTLWIDKETHLLLRRELRVTRVWGDWGPGSSVLFEMFWNGDVMLVKRIATRIGFGARLRDTEQTYSNFKKFGAETEIKFDAVEIP